MSKTKKIISILIVILLLVFSFCVTAFAEPWPVIFETYNLPDFFCQNPREGSGVLNGNYNFVESPVPVAFLARPYLYYGGYISSSSFYAFFPNISVTEDTNYKFRLPLRIATRDGFCIAEKIEIKFLNSALEEHYNSVVNYSNESVRGFYTLRDYIFEGTLSSNQLNDVDYIEIQVYGTDGNLNLGIIPDDKITFQLSGDLDSQYITDNQDKNTDKLIENDKQMYEQEKQESTDTGEQSVEDAMSAMPNDSDGLLDSFGTFIGCMLTNSTDCEIEFPALKTPAIGGLPSYTLSEKQTVNFNEFENIIPNSILLIVRALLTIALIIFCYKELYSTIQYIVSLKKGGGD